MKENIHENHRERMRDRYIRNGIDGMAPHEVLELILYYALPRCDTNPIAHRLIETFGSFSGILNADVEDIAAVSGVGRKTAVFLKLFLDVNRVYETDKTANVKKLSSISEIGEYLKPRFIGRRNETIIMLCLDSKNDIISSQILSEGNVNTAIISLKQAVGTAIRQNAASVVIAHNHPGGEAEPSMKDIETTKLLSAIFRSLNIRFVDHLIFGGDDYTSVYQSNTFIKRDIGILDYYSLGNEPKKIKP